MAFVALDPSDGALVGVSRLSADPDNERAEFALLVRSDRQWRGIGRSMMRQLINYARASNIGLLFGDVLKENDNMLRMCHVFGFIREADPLDAEIQRVTLPLSEQLDPAQPSRLAL